MKTEFIRFLLKANGSKYKVTEINHELFVDHPVCQEMIDRYANGETAILPFPMKNEILWLCLQGDEQKLTIDYASLKKFIFPYRSDEQDQKRLFSRQASELGRLGSEVFPNGFYMYMTTVEKESAIWDSLKLWMTVADRKPVIIWQESVINAYTLRNKFRQQLELKEWGEAEKTLGVIREGHYVSDENFLFLQVELWSAQNKWKDIWHWKEYEALSGLQRIPKDVKVSLLTAFYFVKLADFEIEGHFEASYENFKVNRFQLRLLLDTHLGIAEDHILRIFAYEATVEQNREKLNFIKNQVKLEDTLALIAFLESKFVVSVEPPVKPTLSPENRAKEYLLNGQIDDAYLALQACSLSKEKVGMLAVIGFETFSSDVQKEAYQLLLELPQTAQDELVEDSHTKKYIQFIKMANEGIQKKPSQEDMKYTWNHWFQKVLEVESGSLDHLFDVLYDEEKLPVFVWSPSMIAELGSLMEEVYLTSFDSKKSSVLKEGITVFISELTRDKEFPRTMTADLYGFAVELLLLHLNKNKINTNYLNRLLEGLLQLKMLEINKYWEWARDWYDVTPMKIMIPNLLFTLELFYDYGQDLDQLRDVWNQWTSTLLNGIAQVSPAEIHDWIKLGENIGGELFLINTVRDLVKEEVAEEDEIASAPAASIVIFTLRESSAKRAAEQLMKRNPKLKIRINLDTHLTTQAKSQASNSDVVVLVTTAMKHALFYGITPYLKSDPVYPSSSGTSSIVAEIEKHFSSVVAV
ncbi:protein DpdD [Bacillus sp. X1(2014)]|uniref:protein DpdD n=1 Tax=Bacillus sp. X1(2014) TaxID=1565991 RepID=UPI0011A6C57C|nr:protein DpdD [Bacillus sp. X1(2014)]